MQSNLVHVVFVFEFQHGNCGVGVRMLKSKPMQREKKLKLLNWKRDIEKNCECTRQTRTKMIEKREEK